LIFECKFENGAVLKIENLDSKIPKEQIFGIGKCYAFKNQGFE